MKGDKILIVQMHLLKSLSTQKDFKNQMDSTAYIIYVHDMDEIFNEAAYRADIDFLKSNVEDRNKVDVFLCRVREHCNN